MALSVGDQGAEVKMSSTERRHAEKANHVEIDGKNQVKDEIENAERLRDQRVRRELSSF